MGGSRSGAAMIALAMALLTVGMMARTGDACTPGAQSCIQCTINDNPDCVYCEAELGCGESTCPGGGAGTSDWGQCQEALTCGGYASCDDCLNWSHEDCRWCEATGSCYPAGAQGEVNCFDIRDDQSSCDSIGLSESSGSSFAAIFLGGFFGLFFLMICCAGFIFVCCIQSQRRRQARFQASVANTRAIREAQENKAAVDKMMAKNDKKKDKKKGKKKDKKKGKKKKKGKLGTGGHYASPGFNSNAPVNFHPSSKATLQMKMSGRRPSITASSSSSSSVSASASSSASSYGASRTSSGGIVPGTIRL